MSTHALVPHVRDPKLEDLVATYAPIGRSLRKQEQLRRGVFAGGCALVVSASILLAMSDLTLPVTTRSSGPVTAELSPGEANQSKAEREMFLTRLAELEAQFASVSLQRQELDDQRVRLQAQGDRLEQLLAAADAEQSDLEMRAQHGSQLDKEIAAMAAQREELAKRLSLFEAQGDLLAMELLAVNAQRKELETQRSKIDQQQRALAELIDRAEGLYRRAAGSAPKEINDETAVVETEDQSFTDMNDIEIANVNDIDVNEMIVQNGELDEMRGGFTVGNGLNVSFGFTQTGEINGVEQYNNNFTINSMADGFQSGDVSNINSVLLQQGSGNFVSPDVLDAMGNTFGSVIQNSLDDQTISTTTIYDISLQNVPGTVQGILGEQALMDSLGSFNQ